MADKIVTHPNVHQSVKRDKLDPELLNKPVEIDEIVKDPAAYKIWLQMEKSEWLNDKRTYEASDGSQIDLAIITPWLKKRILHLPATEQEHIWDIKTNNYQKARLLANQWKKKAFGVVPGPKKQTKEGDDPKRQKQIENANVARFAMLIPRTTELIELFGRMFTIDEVFVMCVEDWGLPANKKMLSEFRNHYADIISDKINHHKRSFADLRLGIKKSRLEEFCWIYAELKKDYKKSRQVKMVEQMRGVLQDIRKEIEGDKIIIEGNLDINIEASVNDHLQNEVLKNLSIRDLIIGRVAARVGSNPALLVYYLTKSYYARFSGTTGPIEDAAYETIQYPNDSGYDFAEIEKNQQRLLGEPNQPELVAPLPSTVNQSAGEKLRQRLLSIALAKTSDMERTQTANTIVISPRHKE